MSELSESDIWTTILSSELPETLEIDATTLVRRVESRASARGMPVDDYLEFLGDPSLTNIYNETKARL